MVAASDHDKPVALQREMSTVLSKSPATKISGPNAAAYTLEDAGTPVPSAETVLPSQDATLRAVVEEASEMEKLPVMITAFVDGCKNRPLATPFVPRGTEALQDPLL